MFSKYSVKKPYTVLVGVVLVLVLGVISFMNMTTDLLPSMDLPYVVIYTSYTGASPEEVEMTISKPVEAAMATVSNVKNISSVSGENSAQVVLEFNAGVNMDSAIIEINGKLDLIKPNWPDGVGAPVVLRLNPDMLPILVASVDVEGMSGADLSHKVSEEIIPALEGVEGVASVSSSGLIEEEIGVTISQERIDVLNSIILEEVDSELAKVERELSEGERQLREAKRQISKMEREALAKINEGLKQIEAGRAQMEALKATLLQEQATMNAALNELLASEQELLAAREQLLSQCPEMTDEQRARLAELTQQINELTGQRQALEQQLEEVNSQITQAEGENPGSNEQVTLLKQEIADWERELAQLASKREQLEKYRDDLLNAGLTPEEREAWRQAREALKEAQQARDRAQANLEAAQAQLPALTDQLNVRQQEDAQKRAAAEEALRVQEEADALVERLAGDLQDMRAQMEDLKAQREEAAQKGEETGLLDASISSLSGHIEAGERQLQQAQAEAEQAAQKAAPLKAEADQAHEAFLGAQMALDQVNDQVAIAQGDLTVAQADIDEQQALLDELELKRDPPSEQDQRIIEETEHKIEEITQQQAQLEEELVRARQQLEELLAQLNPELVKLREQAQQLQEEIDHLDSEVNALQPEYLQLIQLQEGMSEDLRAQLEEIEAQLAEVQTQRASLEQGLAAIQQQLAAIDSGVTPEGISLDEQEQQLLAAKEELKQQISKARSQVNEGQRKLGKARKEFEENRQEAFEEAKLDGIITMDMIGSILPAQNFQMPAGYIEEDGQKYLVKVGDEYDQLQQMKQQLLFTLELDSLKEVRLQDVAVVEVKDNSEELYTKVNGNDGVILTFQKQSTFSTADVTGNLKERFESLSAQDSTVRLTTLMDQGIYINMIVDSVLENLLYGGALAILVLLIFLADFRPTLIIACSIPLSVVAAFVLMYFTGITLNVISLAGLALGVGMLVDNSIVVIENIYRLRNEGVPLLQACVQGASQVAGAIFSSTLTTICVFLPIVFVQGIARDLFTDMGLTIAYSLLASLVVALTLVPAMASALFKKRQEKSHRVFQWIQRGYGALLKGALKGKLVVIALCAALLWWSVSQVGALGTAFMPEVDSTQMTATLTMPAGSKFDEVTQMADQVLERMLTVEDVDRVGVFNGNGMSMGGSGGGETVSFYLLLKEDKTHDNLELQRMIQQATADLGCELTVKSSEMDITMLGGEGIEMEIKGDDLDTLQRIASDVAGIMRTVEGTTDVSDGQEETVPEIRIVVDKEKAAREGLTVAQVYQAVAKAVTDGSTVTTVTMDERDYPVIVVDGMNASRTQEDLRELSIEVTKGDETNEIYIDEIAEFSMAQSLSSINRDGQKRTVSASCLVDSDHNVGLVGQEIERLVSEYELPEGYSIVAKGENETITQTMSDLMMMILLAIVFIYLIMVAQFQSLMSPFIVLFTIPLALTGGLLALIWAQMELSVIAMLGFLVLSGVVVNNGIVFVDCVNQLRLEGMEKREALIQAGMIRLRPILMTALTTILGMSTIAIGTGMGAEMMQPMAVVTIGGLSYATLLTLFVVPVLYDLFYRKKDMKKRLEED